MLSQYKSQVEQRLQSYLEIFRNVHPNYLTLLGIVPPVLFFVALVNGHPVWAVLALATTSVDALDGMVARKFHKVTRFGGVLDSSIDRVADFLFLWSFAAAQLVRTEIVLALILSAFLTSYLRSRGGLALGDDKVLAVGLIERTERLLAIAGATIVAWCLPHQVIGYFFAVEWVCILLLVLSVITVIQRLIKVAELTRGK